MWRQKENPYASALLSYQRRFIKHGGVIVRLLLSKNEGSADSYQDVINDMAQVGIDARFLYYHHDFSFDFLWITNCENNLE